MPKVKRTPKPKKKTAGKNGGTATPVAEEEEEALPEGIDALVGAVDHDAEAEEHARSQKGAGDDEEEPAEGDLTSLKKMFDDAVKVEDARAALQWTEVECPHCGEAFEVCVDPEQDGQDMVQDCTVCCRSIQMSVEMDGDDVVVTAFHE